MKYIRLVYWGSIIIFNDKERSSWLLSAAIFICFLITYNA